MSLDAKVAFQKRCRLWSPPLLILVAVVVAFSPVFSAGFIWDDDIMLTRNPLISGPLHAFWLSAKPVDYFPLTYTTLWIEWRLWGMNPLGYHITNVLLHALSCVILWRSFVQLNFPAAWLAALLFAVHPVNVESVAWIAERKNVLAMLFYSLTAWSFVCFVRSRNHRFYVLSIAAFILSLLAKPAAAAWPLIAFATGWWICTHSNNRADNRGSQTNLEILRKCCRWVIPFFLSAAIIAPVTIWFQSHNSMGGKSIIQTF